MMKQESNAELLPFEFTSFQIVHHFLPSSLSKINARKASSHLTATTDVDAAGLHKKSEQASSSDQMRKTSTVSFLCLHDEDVLAETSNNPKGGDQHAEDSDDEDGGDRVRCSAWEHVSHHFAQENKLFEFTHMSIKLSPNIKSIEIASLVCRANDLSVFPYTEGTHRPGCAVLRLSTRHVLDE
jgi:hypothetical protein